MGSLVGSRNQINQGQLTREKYTVLVILCVDENFHKEPQSEEMTKARYFYTFWAKNKKFVKEWWQDQWIFGLGSKFWRCHSGTHCGDLCKLVEGVGYFSEFIHSSLLPSKRPIWAWKPFSHLAPLRTSLFKESRQCVACRKDRPRDLFCSYDSLGDFGVK